MGFELGTILFLFGFLSGFLLAYFYHRPTRNKEVNAAQKAVDQLLKEGNITIKTKKE